MKKIKSLLWLITLFISTILFSCKESNVDANRYVVISTGGNEGQLPVFLDTKTKDIYVIKLWDGSPPDIYKKSLNAVEK